MGVAGGPRRGRDERAGLTTTRFFQTPISEAGRGGGNPPPPEAKPSGQTREPCHLAVLCGLEVNRVLGFEAKIPFFFNSPPFPLW